MKITSRSIYDNAKRLKSLVRRPTLQVYSLEGLYDGSNLRALVADDGSTLRYLTKVLFPQGAVVHEKGTIPSVLAPRLAQADVDVVCVGANQFLRALYGKRGFTMIPKWVRLYRPVWDHPDVMISKLTGDSGGAVRRNVRKMKESGFTHEVTDDSAWFDSFYERMYKPYISNRFGELVEVDSYERLKRDFHRGGGLVVNKDGEPAGAVIVFQRGSALWFHRVGIANGDESLTRDGTATALYYYTILLAHSRGCDGVDFGHSRSLASDGVLRYKLKWGMKVLDQDDHIGVFAIATPGRTEVAQRFLAANRFYEFTGGGIELRDG